jgi:phosphoenolpyruvate-protein kinase (PTS system EI component)
MKTLQGIAASRGIVVGPVFHFLRAEIKIERCQVADSSAECARLQSALRVAKSELEII